MKEIKIGTKLFKQSTWGIFEYIVVELKTIETKKHKQIFYIVECQSCADHEKCLIALTVNEYGKLEYSYMVNNYDDEYEENCPIKKNAQYFWHNDGGKPYKIDGRDFFFSIKEVKENTYHKAILNWEKKLEKNIEENKVFEKQIQEYKEIINNL